MRRVMAGVVGTMVGLGALAVTAPPLVSARSAAAATTVRLDVGAGGAQANGPSSLMGLRVVSATGRFVVFSSSASNLVSGDTNGVSDVFVRDTVAGTTALVDVSSSGAESPDGADAAAISPDGRFVVFDTGAALVPGDTNNRSDLYLRDLVGLTTRRVTDGWLGSGFAVTSGGGTVIFDDQGVAPMKIRVWQSATGLTGSAYLGRPVPGGREVTLEAISGDGRYVVFSWHAINAPGPQVVSELDRSARHVALVSRSRSGGSPNNQSQGVAVSSAGRFVLFNSWASNIVAGDTNAAEDAFVRDMTTGTTRRISVSSAGVQARSPSIGMAMSADGRYRLFVTRAANLVPGDTDRHWDLFRRDSTTGVTRRIDLTTLGQPANSGVGRGTVGITADGGFAAFSSTATNLVLGDTNAARDVFWRGPLS